LIKTEEEYLSVLQIIKEEEYPPLLKGIPVPIIYPPETAPES